MSDFQNFMTRRGHLARLIAATKSTNDWGNPFATCPLMNTTVQLVPVRYGLVEDGTPAPPFAVPHKLNSHPVGIRTLRDGYLYVIDSVSGFLHEYLVAEGSLSKLLFQGPVVTEDHRQQSIGEPLLIVSRQATLHACYSEIQWSARKCHQVLDSQKDREHFMQRVSLAGLLDCPVLPNLMDERQAERCLAEVTWRHTPLLQKTLIDGANPDEAVPYFWEEANHYYQTWIEEFTSQVNDDHRHDFQFLVLRDDIGILRDLTAEQLKVADWLGEWSANEHTQREYLTGTYIQSLYAVNDHQLGTLGGPAIKVFYNDTSAEQRAAVFKFLEVKNNYTGPGIRAKGDDMLSRKQAYQEQAATNPLAKAYLDLVEALGEPMFIAHRQAIGELEMSSHRALFGDMPGAQGINDLIDRPAMEAFVAKQQALLAHWQPRLATLQADRLKLVTGGVFHKAAWYYDFALPEQVEHRLTAEITCVAALGDARETLEALHDYLEKSPLVQVPGLDTLPLDDQLDTTKQLLLLANAAQKIYEAPDAARQLKELKTVLVNLVSGRQANYLALNAPFQGLGDMLGRAYDPAAQLRAAEQLHIAKSQFERGAKVDVNAFLRNSGPVSSLRFLTAYARSGLTFTAASADQIRAFNNDRAQAIEDRRHLKLAYQERRDQMRWKLAGGHDYGPVPDYQQQINHYKQRLDAVEQRLTGALTPGGNGPGQIGLVLGNLDAQMSEEFQRSVRDFRATGTYEAPVRGAFRSVGDALAITLFMWQAIKFVEVMSAKDYSAKWSFQEWVEVGDATAAMAYAGANVIQGLSMTILRAHVDVMESTAGKLSSLAKLGKWVGGAGLGVYLWGSIAAGLDLYKHSKLWGEALAEGDAKKLAFTAVMLSTDGVSLTNNAWAFGRTMKIMLSAAEAGTLGWAMKSAALISVGLRCTWIGVGVTVLQVLSEVAYNTFQRTALQHWMATGPWGKKRQPNTLAHDWEALTYITQKPRCQLVSQPDSLKLHITLPGVRTDELDLRDICIGFYQTPNKIKPPHTLWASRKRKTWTEESEAWRSQLQVTSQPDQPLTLTLRMPTNLNDGFEMRVALSYPLDIGKPDRQYSHFSLDPLPWKRYDDRGMEPGITDYEPATEWPKDWDGSTPLLINHIELGDLDVQ